MCGTHDIADRVQNVCQNQAVQPVASFMCWCNDSYCISGANLTWHKQTIILRIFQICISQNPDKCVGGGFSKIRSHLFIYTCISFLNSYMSIHTYIAMHMYVLCIHSYIRT